MEFYNIRIKKQLKKDNAVKKSKNTKNKNS